MSEILSEAIDVCNLCVCTFPISSLPELIPLVLLARAAEADVNFAAWRLPTADCRCGRGRASTWMWRRQAGAGSSFLDANRRRIVEEQGITSE